MGPRAADHLDEDSLGEGEVHHPHAHNRSLRHRCISNNAVVAARPLYKEGEDSILGDGDEVGVKCQRPPPGLVLVYLRSTDRIFYCLTFYVKYILRLCTLIQPGGVKFFFWLRQQQQALLLAECQNSEGWNWECRAILID